MKNDIYFLDIIGNKIVVNDNYVGVIILDAKLNVIKRIKIMDDLVIYTSYHKPNELLLFCPENGCLIHINLKEFTYKKIDLKEFKDLIFSSLYIWNENNLILSTYQGTFFKIDIQNQHIYKMSNYSEELYKIYVKLKDYKIIKIFPDIGKAVVEVNSKEIGIIDYINEKLENLEISKDDFHDIEIKGKSILLLSEKKADIRNSDSIQYYYPEESYICIRGKIMVEEKCRYIFILCGNKSDETDTRIEKLEIF